MAANKRPIIAMMYDFDKTLSPKDMQEYSFIPNMGMLPEDFWAESNRLSEKMDRILAYMYLMIDKANARHTSIRRADFVKLGKDIAFFPGVTQWFPMMNAFAAEAGATIEHYIISSGLKEIIEGTEIAGAFKEIFACEFFYNQNDVAVWPQMAVNYTTKTQFLFRINKGVMDLSDDDALNRYVPEDERRIPFRNMVYVGDGLTDVPCMKLVKTNGGKSIAVYPKGEKTKVGDLLRHGRVDYIAVADYSEKGELAAIMKNIIQKMVADDKLVEMHRRQSKELQTPAK